MALVEVPPTRGPRPLGSSHEPTVGGELGRRHLRVVGLDPVRDERAAYPIEPWPTPDPRAADRRRWARRGRFDGRRWILEAVEHAA